MQTHKKFDIPYMNKTSLIFTAKDLGHTIRAERKALGKTQADLAAEVSCRRQTIMDLEAGRNVTVRTLLATLAGLGKRLVIVDARPEMERLGELLDDPDED